MLAALLLSLPDLASLSEIFLKMAGPFHLARFGGDGANELLTVERALMARFPENMPNISMVPGGRERFSDSERGTALDLFPKLFRAGYLYV